MQPSTGPAGQPPGLAGQNVPPAPVPPLVELFDRWVSRTPLAPAIDGDGGRTTYAEVDAQAHRLRDMLARSGVRCGDAVRVGLVPGLQTLVDLLAIWRLGAVADFRPHGGAGPGAPSPPLGTALLITASPTPEDPGGAGVMVGHPALAGQVRWAARRWAVKPGDRVLSCAGTAAQFCFDAGLALAGGACLIGHPPGASGEQPGPAARRVRATVVTLRAGRAADRGLDPSGWAAPPVRLVIWHDAALDAGSPATATDPRADMWTTFGLASAGSVLAATPLAATPPATTARPAIGAAPGDGRVAGRPIDRVRLSVLDALGRPVVPGDAGQLYVGGQGAPVGLDAAARTVADRLVPDPSGTAGERMFRTGLDVRWGADGLLRVLGEGCGPSSPEPATAVARGLTPAEGIVADAWEEVLGVRPSGARDDFYALGGYSLLVLQLADHLQRATSADVPIGQLFATSTLGAQAALLRLAPVIVPAPGLPGLPEAGRPQSGGPRLPGRGPGPAPGSGPASGPGPGAGPGASQVSGEPEPDEARDRVLDPRIVVRAGAGAGAGSPAVRGGRPRRVLLTGASGFVGSFLLAELQRSLPDATVVCLVRAAGPQEARARLEAGALALRTGARIDQPSVVALPGDLELPRLGLTPDDFARLSTEVDLVLHNGARVNLAEPYARVRAANIGGTQEVIRLAAVRGVPVHFVSTVGVLAGPDPAATLTEDMLAGPTTVAANGYLRSKWVGELLVRQAHERGLPVAVYRLARVSGHTRSGAAREDDAFWTVVRACLELGLAPHGEQWDAVTADLVPVDYVARAITRLVLHEEPDGRAYTLANPVRTPITAVLDRARHLGFALESVPAAEWARRVGAFAEGAYEGSAVPAAAVLSQLAQAGFLAAAPSYERGNTLRALAGAGIDCPPVDADLLDRYLRFFVSSGSWPRPVPRGVDPFRAWARDAPAPAPHLPGAP